MENEEGATFDMLKVPSCVLLVKVYVVAFWYYPWVLWVLRHTKIIESSVVIHVNGKTECCFGMKWTEYVKREIGSLQNSVALVGTLLSANFYQQMFDKSWNEWVNKEFITSLKAKGKLPNNLTLAQEQKVRRTFISVSRFIYLFYCSICWLLCPNLLLNLFNTISKLLICKASRISEDR